MTAPLVSSFRTLAGAGNRVARTTSHARTTRLDVDPEDLGAVLRAR
jgi:hypothetical protein